MTKRLSVELLFAGGCARCAEARDALRQAAQSTPGVDWKEIDVAKEPARAAGLGVVSTPAVAIGGELVFTTLPSAAELREAVRNLAAKR